MSIEVEGEKLRYLIEKGGPHTMQEVWELTAKEEVHL